VAINLDPTVEREWRKVREYWRIVRGDCARCGGPIQYDEPRYKYKWKGGKRIRIENPWALDVGHKVERDRTETGVRIPYPTGKIAPIDTQPEHSRCNRKWGARYGNKKRGIISKVKAANKNLKTSRDW
jgi:hypothetical protein